MDDDCTIPFATMTKHETTKPSELCCAKSTHASRFAQIHFDASAIPFVLISPLGQESKRKPEIYRTEARPTFFKVWNLVFSLLHLTYHNTITVQQPQILADNGINEPVPFHFCFPLPWHVMINPGIALSRH